MRLTRTQILLVPTLCAAAAWGQQSTNQPRIGYLYPAGGQTGRVIRVTAGGQFLRGVTGVYISGQGVHASVVEYIRPLRNIQREQRQLLQQRLKEVRQKRLAELSPNGPDRPAPGRRAVTQQLVVRAEPATQQEQEQTAEVKLPDHPLLYDLDDKSLRELAHISSILFFPRAKVQDNRQLAEMVVIEVTIDADAEPGDRELRFQTATGLTNAVVFQVGTLPEVRELEPNDKQAYPPLPGIPRTANLPEDKALDLPVLLNGQILPGDTDRFRFHARKGQRLVMEVQARSLIPYLADAVPGWFQATLALYDADGKEVAFVDDYRFNPDPVLFFEVPATSEYELEIRDSIYRGREDFVYRVAVSERPFITQMFPLGGQSGVKTVASVSGWNLSETPLPLDTRPGPQRRKASLSREQQVSNSVPYMVDTLPECDESETNDTIENAQRIELPKIINGRIDQPGDVDVFSFEARAGEKIAAEVYARRLNSPLDSLLKLTDASGRVIEWNDDYVLESKYLYKNTQGLLTHHADSYLTAELPSDGPYYVRLADSERHGGRAYGYRLHVTEAQGDFALCVTPSTVSMRAGGIAPMAVYALRKDGFDGEIEVVLQDAPDGFELDGARIPAGCNYIRMTLKAPASGKLEAAEPVPLQLEGRARIGGRTISRRAIPADEVMQAFLYRHLVPANALLAFVQKARWGAPPVELAGDGPVRIPAGGSATVQFRTANRRANFKGMQLELNEPPEGLTLRGVHIVPGGLEFRLQADKELMQDGFTGNLIVEAIRETPVQGKDGKPTNQKRRFSMGVFPAIPVRVVQ